MTVCKQTVEIQINLEPIKRPGLQVDMISAGCVYLSVEVDSLPNILISNLMGITFLCEVTTFIKVCVAFVFVLQTL